MALTINLQLFQERVSIRFAPNFMLHGTYDQPAARKPGVARFHRALRRTAAFDF
jgi:hypothetical protein